MPETVKKSFDIPIKFECDVLIIGGGPAGLAAAVASSRHGARTILMEQYGCIGGMATVGLVGPFMTSFDTEGREQIVKGIFLELIEQMTKIGGAINPAGVPAGSIYTSFHVEAHHNTAPFDPEAMKYIAMEMLLEAKVRLLLHTRFVSTIVRDNTIDTVIFSDKSGLGGGRAKIVIDATGDGDVAASAGNPYHKGRIQDGKMQPATLFFRIGNVLDEKVIDWVNRNAGEGEKPFATPLFASFVAKARKEGRFPENLPRTAIQMYRQPRKGEWRINTSLLLDVDGTDPDSLTAAEIEGRRQVMQLMKFFNTYCPGLENAYLIDTGNQVGIRETRLIEGKYTLTMEDVRTAARFSDAIARCGYFIDVPNPSGKGLETGEPIRIIGGRFFEIPFRCIVPSKTKNLLVAGRCISTDRLAQGATRVMPACFATGQAAGTAGALAVRYSCEPSAIDIIQLQKDLRIDNCVV